MGCHPNDTATLSSANSFLATLDAEDFRLLLPQMKPCHREAGSLIYDRGDIDGRIYFPCGAALVSYLVILDGGRSIEGAMVGREGVVGPIGGRGKVPAFVRAEVRSPGELLIIQSRDLAKAKAQSARLADQLARYADCLLTQILQSVACARSHSIEQRLVCRLLGTAARLGEKEISLTQDQLATRLGIGRQSRCNLLQSLQRRGIPDVRRGGLRVIDRRKLKLGACACSGAVTRHFDGLLKGVYPAGRGPTGH